MNDEMTKAITVYDQAIFSAIKYTDKNEEVFKMLMRDEGFTFNGVIKNSYQEGFLAGFAYRLGGEHAS